MNFTKQKAQEIILSNFNWRGGDYLLMYHYIVSSAIIYKYKYMLVNIERGEKITIKEYALHKIADTPILAGEK
jgi:hypothetical protein